MPRKPRENFLLHTRTQRRMFERFRVGMAVAAKRIGPLSVQLPDRKRLPGKKVPAQRKRPMVSQYYSDEVMRRFARHSIERANRHATEAVHAMRIFESTIPDAGPRGALQAERTLGKARIAKEKTLRHYHTLKGLIKNGFFSGKTARDMKERTTDTIKKLESFEVKLRKEARMAKSQRKQIREFVHALESQRAFKAIKKRENAARNALARKKKQLENAKAALRRAEQRGETMGAQFTRARAAFEALIKARIDFFVVRMRVLAAMELGALAMRKPKWLLDWIGEIRSKEESSLRAAQGIIPPRGGGVA